MRVAFLSLSLFLPYLGEVVSLCLSLWGDLYLSISGELSLSLSLSCPFGVEISLSLSLFLV